MDRRDEEIKRSMRSDLLRLGKEILRKMKIDKVDDFNPFQVEGDDDPFDDENAGSDGSFDTLRKQEDRQDKRERRAARKAKKKLVEKEKAASATKQSSNAEATANEKAKKKLIEKEKAASATRQSSNAEATANEDERKPAAKEIVNGTGEHAKESEDIDESTKVAPTPARQKQVLFNLECVETEEFPESLQEMTEKHAETLLASQESFERRCKDGPGNLSIDTMMTEEGDNFSPVRGRSLVADLERPNSSWDASMNKSLNRSQNTTYASAVGSIADANGHSKNALTMETPPKLKRRSKLSLSPVQRSLRETPERKARSTSTPALTRAQQTSIAAGETVEVNGTPINASTLRRSTRKKLITTKSEDEYLSSDYET
jgi:hypothetical protein